MHNERDAGEVCETMFAGEDGWSAWVHPLPGYRMQCCDCDLIHDMEFQIVPANADGALNPGETADGVVIFRARREVNQARRDALTQMVAIDEEMEATRPPTPEDAGTVERVRQGLSDIFEHFKDRKQAPGHDHCVPGIWDDNISNGEMAGQPCDWCAKWNAARAALAALSRLD